jgi:hypothetical protein
MKLQPLPDNLGWFYRRAEYSTPPLHEQPYCGFIGVWRNHTIIAQIYTPFRSNLLPYKPTLTGGTQTLI